MKRYFLAAVCAFACTAAAFAQMTIESSGIATFELQAHTTVGVDLETGTAGMETAIDQMQIWFEIFPYATRGVPAKKPEAPLASIRAEGSKYAFKWFAKQENTPGQSAMTYDEFVPSLEFERVIAEVLYKDWWFRVAGTEPSLFANRASLKSIFDDVIKESQYSKVPISMLPLNQNLVSVGSLEIPVTGMLSAGADFEKVSFAVKGGAKGTWKTNTDDAWIGGADLTVKPVKGLALSLSGLAAMNYGESAGSSNPLSAGAGIEYLIGFTDKVALKPFAGYDFKYDTVSEKSAWEAGGGVFLFWRGSEYKTTHSEIHQWNKKFPVGLSLSANTNQDQYTTVVCSLFEETGSEALVPNLGGFIEFEALNIGAVTGLDSAMGAAGQIEYLINKKVKPYLFGKYVQGYKAGKLTDTDTVTTRIGVELLPIKRFVADFRYERTDAFGKEKNLDNGTLTTTLKMKL